jgi:hypothetical protein
MKLSIVVRNVVAASVLALIIAAPSNAQVIGVFGSGSEGDNLLFNNNDTNAINPIDAVLNGDPTYHAKINSTTDGLTAQGSGQATIAPDDNLLNEFTLCATPGNVFWQVIGNAQGGSGMLSFSATGAFGTVGPTDIGELGNGQNFFTIRADPGVGIDCITLYSPDGYSGQKQLRLASGPAPGDVSTIVPGETVPEPGAYTLLAGMGAMGVGFFRLRKRR